MPRSPTRMPAFPSHGPRCIALPGPCRALSPVPDQPVAFPGAGDPVRLQEMDGHRRHDSAFVWSHLGTERRQEIVQGGLGGRR